MLLIIDHYDSFTYNLVQYFAQLGAEVRVFPHDKIGLAEIVALNPQAICLSPGPFGPDQSRVCLALLKDFVVKRPILGVCLGQQVIGAAFGAKIIAAPRIMHGKLDMIYTDQQGLFSGLPARFSVMRYHSLAVDPDTLPDALCVTARSSDGTVMGLRHRTHAIYGVQFHPESVLSEHGLDLCKNFLALSARAGCGV
jgi:anthranilate synthase component II